MKKVSLPLLLIFSFSLFAQDDDYCPCQDEMAQEAEIFDYFSSINSQIAVYVPRENNFDPVPQAFEEPEPMTIVFPPKEKEEELTGKDNLDLDKEDIKEQTDSKIDARKSKMKKLKKRRKVKVKRKKKSKKYKGKCPFF